MTQREKASVMFKPMKVLRFLTNLKYPIFKNPVYFNKPFKIEFSSLTICVYCFIILKMITVHKVYKCIILAEKIYIVFLKTLFKNYLHQNPVNWFEMQIPSPIPALFKHTLGSSDSFSQSRK